MRFTENVNLRFSYSYVLTLIPYSCGNCHKIELK